MVTNGSPTATPTDSRAGTMQPESTLPSSPMTELTNGETKPMSDNGGNTGQDQSTEKKDEDVEGMDTKAKGLMHLLQSSSVSRRRAMQPDYFPPVSNRVFYKVIRRPHVG